MDTSSPEFQEALRDHAKSLGVDPDSEGFLLPLVQEALLAELPPDWEQGETEDGTLYYFNTSTEESIWEHPLDAHYRDLIQTKKQDRVTEKTPTEAVEPSKPSVVSNSVDVYSFDDVSDEDEPMPATKPALETRKSRIDDRFAKPSVQTPAVQKPISALQTPTPVTGFGFGRDRSWLLDGDDDDTPPKPLGAAASVVTTPASSISFLRQEASSEPRVEEKPSVGTPISSLGSFGSRRTTPSTSNSTATGTLGALVMQKDTEQSRGAGSRRAGDTNAVEKSSFFVDVPQQTASPSGGTSPMALAKLQELEKKLEDATSELERERTAHAETTKQLQTAQLDAKESNYLKMKVAELKSKLSDQENQEKQKHEELVALKSENEKLSKQQSQKVSRDEAAQKQREALEAKQNELDALQRRLEELEQQLKTANATHAQVMADKEKVLADAREKLVQIEASTANDREQYAKEAAAAREQHTIEVETLRAQQNKEASVLREQLAELGRQLETMRGTAEERAKRCEQLDSLEEKLSKQEALAQELEDANRELKTQMERAVRDAGDWCKKHEMVGAELEDQCSEVSRLRAELMQAQSDARKLVSNAEHQQQQSLERERLTAEAEAQAQSRIQKLQAQLSAQLDDHAAVKTQLQTEIRELRGELAGVQAQELKPLEKQRDQLQREVERALERASGLEKELRGTRQELATQTDKAQQLEVEVDVLVRREQQRKVQQETLSSAKNAAEKQLAALQDELLTTQHDRRLEGDKLSFRVRELESQVAQKEYEGARLEERFAKAETWRQKEATRVEKRDAQLLELREQLTALQARNVEAETGAALQELREAKFQAEKKAQQLESELSEQREARKRDEARQTEELQRIQQAVEWQLPQLAQACVTRSSDEWARKCRAMTQQVRDELTMRALEERNALVAREQKTQESCERLEQKLKTAVAESEFLRREVHRLEDNSKVLLEQLHTIRVYLTQRPMPSHAAGVASSAWAWPGANMSTPQPAMSPSGSSGGGTTPLGPFSDFATVNQLNAQLGVLHAQFQQLFDASEQRRSATTSARSSGLSPSERFEIPSSPQAKAAGSSGFRESATRDTKMEREREEEEDAAMQRLALDTLLDQKLAANSDCNARSPAVGDVHKQQQELLTSLEALGVASGPQWLPVVASGAIAGTTGSGAAMGPAGDALHYEQPAPATLWYQQDYWRRKYQ